MSGFKRLHDHIDNMMGPVQWDFASGKHKWDWYYSFPIAWARGATSEEAHRVQSLLFDKFMPMHVSPERVQASKPPYTPEWNETVSLVAALIFVGRLTWEEVVVPASFSDDEYLQRTSAECASEYMLLSNSKEGVPVEIIKRLANSPYAVVQEIVTEQLMGLPELKSEVRDAST